MRAVVVWILSFVVALTIGMLMLPDMAPTHKPKPLKVQAPVAPDLIFPALPSLRVTRVDDPSKQYEEAGRLLKARQYRAAEGAYLQILTRSPHDRKGMDGLVTLRRLQANQDPQKLREQAAGYRRAIVEGRVTAENYTPREMELLAEASLSAASEITAEQNRRVGVSSRTSIGSDLAHPTAWRLGNKMRNPPAAIREHIPRMALGERPRLLSQNGNAIGTPASGAPQPPAKSITVTPAVASPRDAIKPGSPIGRLPDPVTPSTPDSAQQPAPDSIKPGPSGSVVPANYILGPGDQIEINVPNLIVTVTIKPDGVIALPLISRIRAAGKTAAQLEIDLTRMYSRFLEAPSITVLVRQFRMNHISY